MTTLYNVKIGNKCVIKEVFNTFALKRRLFELGLVKGVFVEVKASSVMGKVMLVEYNGTTIAIRDDVAKKIEVNAV